MGKFVTMGAMLQCSFGMAPTALIVNVPLRPKCGNMLMATTMDMVPGSNIPTFGMCQSLANPSVALFSVYLMLLRSSAFPSNTVI